MAVKDSIGGRKSNALDYKTSKACTTGVFFMGKVLSSFMKGIGIHNFTCPIPKVFYFIFIFLKLRSY